MAANGDSDALMVYPTGRKRLLSTGMVVFLVVSAAAPLTAMAGNMPIGLSFPAGLGMPMAFVVVAAILACFAVGYAELSRAVKGTGAFYTYIGRGLGKPAGVVAAYCAVLAYAAMSVGLAAAFGYFGSVLFDQLGLKVPWMACAVAGLAIIGIMGYLALDFSARALAFFMTAEFLVLAAFDLSVLAAKGWASFPMEVWRPENYVRWDFGAILPFAVTSFIGIEAAALYGEETRRPERSIPIATFTALFAVAIFYFVTVWIMIGAAGADHVQAFAKEKSGDFLFDLTTQYGGDLLTTFAGLFFVTSLLAAYLALHNAASKYMFALAADGLLPTHLTQVHPHYRSPTAASFLMTSIETLIVIGLGFAGVAPYLGIASGAIGLGTVGIIAMQLVCAFAVVGFFWNSERANRADHPHSARYRRDRAHALPDRRHRQLQRADRLGQSDRQLAASRSHSGCDRRAPLCALDEARAAREICGAGARRASAFAGTSRAEGRLRAPLLHRGRGTRRPYHGAGVARGGRSLRRL